MVLKASGSYGIVIWLEKDQQIEVGKLGLVDFKEGYYIYVGSALNGQLGNRTLRHTKPAHMKKKHWHIDFFLTHDSTHIDRIFLIPSQVKYECEVANVFSQDAFYGIKRFGCSDCKCKSHLLFYGKIDIKYLR